MCLQKYPVVVLFYMKRGLRKGYVMKKDHFEVEALEMLIWRRVAKTS